MRLRIHVSLNPPESANTYMSEAHARERSTSPSRGRAEVHDNRQNMASPAEKCDVFSGDAAKSETQYSFVQPADPSAVTAGVLPVPPKPAVM
ncbi:hypothetical protein PSCLAVI8L_80049 [Pseudoclavibacter sp. 8L]|nr:hypothetical protein PSCLAVI8L_80049 [Pseudoclavibacter sp. 8L]